MSIVPSPNNRRYFPPTTVNQNQNQDFDIDFGVPVPYIPKGTSKVLFEVSKLLIHDDRKDVFKFSYMGHPSRTHHWLWGGLGIAASTLTGLLEKVNEMFDDVAAESDPNNRQEQQMIQLGRFLQHKATQGVQELNYLAQHPPMQRTMVIEHHSYQNNNNVPISPPMQQNPIYMGKIQPKTVPMQQTPTKPKLIQVRKSLPPPPPPPPPPKSKIIPTMPSFLANKGKPTSKTEEA